MIKTKKYYLSVDLQSLASSSTRNKDERKRDAAWAEICDVLFARAGVLNQRIPQQDLFALLGEPDRIKMLNGSEIWEYDCIGKYGPSEFQSTTHFQLANGIVIGIAKNGEDCRIKPV